MTGPAAFGVEIFQNEYLPTGGRDVDAIVTVTGPAGGAGHLTSQPAAATAQVIIVDSSGSMDYPASKMREAKQATAAAVDVLRDGVHFAVIRGTDVATMAYPVRNGLAVASAATRAAAKKAVTGMRPTGGTAIGRWLRLAGKLLTDAKDLPAGAIKHAILLTDGRNQHETPGELDLALRHCEQVFTCDCRGVGTDWEVRELRRIADHLLGSVDIVAEPEGLAADFTAMTTAAMGKRLAEANLRLWTPQHAEVRFVKQVAPDMLDLTGRRVDSGPRTGDYPTGSWGDESRDYHIGVRVQPASVGDRMLAGRVSLVTPTPDGPGEVLAQGRILAVWTDDEAMSTRINREVAHYTGQAELAEAIADGLAARKEGDVPTATAKLGRAVALANQLGNDDTAKLLGKVVDVDDPVTGTVRLRARVASVDEMTLDTRSTKTARVSRIRNSRD